MTKVNPNTKQILKQAEQLSLRDILKLANNLLLPHKIKDLTVGELEELANFLNNNSDILSNKVSVLMPYFKGLNSNNYRSNSPSNSYNSANNPFISKPPTENIIQSITIGGSPLGEGLSTEGAISLYDADAEVQAQNAAYNHSTINIVEDEVEVLSELFNSAEVIDDVQE